MPRNWDNSATGFHVFSPLTCAASQNSRYQRNTSNRDLQPSHCLCRLPTRKNSTAPPTCKWWSFSIIVSHIYEGSLKWLHHLQHLIRLPGLDTLSRPSWSSLPYLPRDHLRCTWSYIFSIYLDNKTQRVPNRNNMYQTKLNGHLSSSTRFLTTPPAHRDNRDSCRESLSAGNKGGLRAPLHRNSVQVWWQFVNISS